MTDPFQFIAAQLGADPSPQPKDPIEAMVAQVNRSPLKAQEKPVRKGRQGPRGAYVAIDLETTRKAFAMRARGMTYTEIGRRLGYEAKTIKRALTTKWSNMV